MMRSMWRKNEGMADMDFRRCQMQARGCSVVAVIFQSSTSSVPWAFQDNAVVRWEVLLCLKLLSLAITIHGSKATVHKPGEWTRRIQSFYSSKTKCLAYNWKFLLSVCHLTWTNKGDIFIPMDQGMLVTALTDEKMIMVYVCDKPFRDRLETSLSMRCNLKQYQGLNLHCYKL